MKALLLLIPTTLAFSLSAGAQRKVVDAPDEIRYHKVQRIEFGNETIKGRLVKPTFEIIRSKRRANFRSMIELRSSFRPELSRSIEKL